MIKGVEFQVGLQSWETNSSQICFGGHPNILEVFGMDHQRCFGKNLKDLLQVPMIQKWGQTRYSLGQLEEVGCSEYAGRMGP